jgi:uncharacterized protein with gpF-like domain
MPDLTEDIFKIAFNLPPEKAQKYLESKGFKFSWSWTDVYEAAHELSFTVAKVMRADVLESIRQIVERSLNDGITFDKFQRLLEPYLKLAGWWGRTWATNENGDLLDENGDPWPLDEEGNPIIPYDRIPPQLGSPWRLGIIYSTNLQQALNAGRYQGMMEVAKERPYWQYLLGSAHEHTQLCTWLNGKIYPADDPFWKKFYPQNHFGCTGRVISLSDHEMTRDGLEPLSSAGKIGETEVLVSTKTGKKAKVATIDTGDGVLSVAPGFSYNPGDAAFKADLKKYDPKIAKQLKKALR